MLWQEWPEADGSGLIYSVNVPLDLRIEAGLGENAEKLRPAFLRTTLDSAAQYSSLYGQLPLSLRTVVSK
jgi:hypothetical protein